MLIHRDKMERRIFIHRDRTIGHCILISHFRLLNSLLKKIVTPEESFYLD